MNWSGLKVLVTGAGGFIGSHLTERLVRAGATVRAMVHYNAIGSAGWLDRSPIRDDVEIFSGDVGDRDSVRAAMQGSEVVFHLAALIGIPYSYRSPASYVRTNVEGTLNVLQAARDSNVRRLVHTSTSEVYGTAQVTPITEDHPLKGQSPYAATKIGADKLIEAFHCSFGMPLVTLRPFNTFGPRQSARALIPSIIVQCLHGEVVRLGNVHPTRDFTFVSDIVEGYVLAADSPSAIGKTINLGSGKEVKVSELVPLIGDLVGHRVQVVSEANRERPASSEVERLVASSELAQNLLGWKARVDFADGLATTIAWMRENPGLFRPDAYVI